jgi:hydroxypyruvate isomerase
MLFGEHDFLDRFDAAARAGFKGVEYIGPYDFIARCQAARTEEERPDPGAVQPAGRRLGQGRARHCRAAGPGEEFRQGVAKAIAYAQALGCQQVNCLAGIAPTGADRKRAGNDLRRKPRLRGGQAGAGQGIRLVIEPINTRDIPGFFLNTTDQALAMIARKSVRNLFLQYDIYHMQIMEGDLARTIEANLAASRISSWRTIPAVTSRARARSTTLPLRASRPHRLFRLDRLRIQAEGRHRGRPGLVQPIIGRAGSRGRLSAG